MMKLVVALMLIFSSSIFAQQDIASFARYPYLKKLSEWKIFVQNGEKIELGSRVVPYDLVNPLFSDYALKFRTLWVPEGKK